MDKNIDMKKLCKKCNKEKPYADFVHKHFPDTYCVECNVKQRAERYRNSQRRNETGWMDMFIGRQEKIK